MTCDGDCRRDLSFEDLIMVILPPKLSPEEPGDRRHSMHRLKDSRVCILCAECFTEAMMEIMTRPV